MNLTLTTLTDAVREAAALRRVQRLQPVGGTEDTLFPPTYPGQDGKPRHVFERRVRAFRADGDASANGPSVPATREVWTVLLDSVQSQANRLEEVLLDAATDGLPLPFATVDFTGLDLHPLERITSLDAPHRVYDAILRDSSLADKPFMESEPGRRLASAKPGDATALLELSPNALLFGAWHSQGQGGGMGAKFPRVLVSEIVGVDTPVDESGVNRATGQIDPRPAGRRPGSRIDPLGIRAAVPIFKDKDANWNTTKEGLGARIQSSKPSAVNHGNVAPSVEPLGVTCAYAEHRVVITCAGLRRLRFGGSARNDAGRVLLAALGIVAVAEQDTRGYCLRSRCDLVCDGRADLEIVHADGSTEPFQADRETVLRVYREAYQNAEAAGFRFESLTLVPQPKLVEIIRQSREMALAGRGEEAAEA